MPEPILSLFLICVIIQFDIISIISNLFYCLLLFYKLITLFCVMQIIIFVIQNVFVVNIHKKLK
jgi:hypothetical protein